MAPTFLAPGANLAEDKFSVDGGVGLFRMIQAHYEADYALCFYCYCISSSSQIIRHSGLGVRDPCSMHLPIFMSFRIGQIGRRTNISEGKDLDPGDENTEETLSLQYHRKKQTSPNAGPRTYRNYP